jgi:uncharacterized protein involved in tolerance to divalent cations
MNVRLQKICVELLKTSFGTLTELEIKKPEISLYFWETCFCMSWEKQMNIRFGSNRKKKKLPIGKLHNLYSSPTIVQTDTTRQNVV